MNRISKISAILVIALSSVCLTSCGGGTVAQPKAQQLGPAPSYSQRSAQIANEAKGDFYYARRYFVNKTRFWGYVREPGQQWTNSKLVIMNESRTTVPDRLPEKGPKGKRYAHDQNYEYIVTGNYTGKKAYDPNTNLFLPEFKPTSFKLVNSEPGWIFAQNDYYDPKRITLRSR